MGNGRESFIQAGLYASARFVLDNDREGIAAFSIGLSWWLYTKIDSAHHSTPSCNSFGGYQNGCTYISLPSSMLMRLMLLVRKDVILMVEMFLCAVVPPSQ